MGILYRILSAASILFLAPYYAWRGWHRGEPAGTFRQRFGIVPREIVARAASDHSAQNPSAGSIWIHAVSVGEVLAAKPLLESLQQRFPRSPVFVSTTTETGQKLARERLASAAGIFYFPLDLAFSVRRALEAIRPVLVIIMETEIWPNFLREARRRAVPVVFANARISEKSFARYRRWNFFVDVFYEETLRNASLFLAQSPEDAQRLAAMHAPPDAIQVTGNMKYDAEPPAPGPFAAWLAEEIQRQERWPVLVAGSVVAGEEEAVLAAYDIVQRQWRHALLILAPRKPDRFDAAAEISSLGGWTAIRRSSIDPAAPLDENADVLVLDSIGELGGLYSLADAVFVGGSLVHSGGHNILEPAWFSRPPVFGPSMENFQEMAECFLSARAGIQVSGGPMLGKVWVQLIEDKTIRERMGRAAREISERNRGATAKSLAFIATLLEAGVPRA
ncbi:MAG TPA: 3-deoxy-D-manno-octulosonic acid transferase [Candidatus Acidoferrales bacterium]|jgi:3-deoxy-D-manno-octulosonic-acid transferase